MIALTESLISALPRSITALPAALAPDHLHFSWPLRRNPVVAQIKRLIEEESGRPMLKRIEARPGGACFTGCPDFRTVFICVTSSPDFLQERFARALGSLPAAGAGEEEPMVNALIAGFSGTFYGILFPRRAHRPARYFKDDSEKMVVSPGAVDVGGLLILPRREDFERINREMILEIFREVCEEQEVFARFQI